MCLNICSKKFKKTSKMIYVTRFSSISYYSNVRLISKIEFEQNFQSTILDVHVSANERPLHIMLNERVA